MKTSTRGIQSIETDNRSWPSHQVRSQYTSYDELLSFDEQMAALEPELNRFVARKVAAEAVDDVLQEVRVAAWQALPSYDHRSKFRTWIYAICVHKCHDHYRAKRIEARNVPIDELPLFDSRPSAEQAVVQADTIDRLLAELDENHRVVLELYYYAQLTLAEIAAALNRNLNTVKYQFYRAHSELLAAGGREGLL